MRRRDARRLLRRLDARRDRRAARGCRRRAAACRRGSRARARRASRAAPPSPARRAATSRPPRRRAPACARAAPRSAETSGGFGKPRCTPPIPPVAMKRIPTARATASVPPTVVAPTAPWTAAAPRSRGPDLARGGVEASELLLRQPDAHLAVEDADRRRDGARARAPALRLEPDRDAFAGREAVRDERRLERDDGASAGERLAHLLRDADHAERSISTKRLSSAGAPRGSRRAGTRAARARSSARPRAGSPRPPLAPRVVEAGVDERLREPVSRSGPAACRARSAPRLPPGRS